MTNADRAAVDALARHFAYEGGGFWEHLDPREQATYRARALDVVQVVGPIYQGPPGTHYGYCVKCDKPVFRCDCPTTALGKIAAAAHNVPDTYTPAFPRPRSADR